MQDPIFIVGEGRSGTTSLRNIIGEHPNIWAVDKESYLFVENWPQANPYFDIYKNNFNKLVLSVFVATKRVGENAHKIIKSKKLPEDIETEFYLFKESLEYAELKKNYKNTETINRFQIFNAISEFYCKRFSRARFVEKTPYHLYYVNSILNEYPNAKIIALYRDPRAVCSSWLKLDALKNLLGVCLSWNKAMKEITKLQKKLNQEQFLTVKFENLISNPKETLEEICSFINEDFEQSLLESKNVSNSSFNKGTGFRTENLERWKKILNKKQISLINLICSKHYQKYNIEKSQEKLKISELVALPLFISLEPLKLFTVKLKKLFSRL